MEFYGCGYKRILLRNNPHHHHHRCRCRCCCHPPSRWQPDESQQQQHLDSDDGPELDKELDITKDNLKSFVERWDGHQQTATIVEDNGNNGDGPAAIVSDESRFTAPARPDNESISPAIPNQKRDADIQHQPAADAKDVLPIIAHPVVKCKSAEGNITKKKRSEGEKVPKTSNKTEVTDATKKGVAKSRSAINVSTPVEVVVVETTGEKTTVVPSNDDQTKVTLLAQLEQIEIREPEKTEDEPVPPTSETADNSPMNGSNYLQVINNSSSNTASTLSSRGNY